VADDVPQRDDAEWYAKNPCNDVSHLKPPRVVRCCRATLSERAARRTPAATLEVTDDPIRTAMALVLLSYQPGGGMSKSRAKKATTRKAALVTAAEKAGRSLGRAVGAVERAISRVRAPKPGKPVRKRAQSRKRR
jgi:hypothetical protein